MDRKQLLVVTVVAVVVITMTVVWYPATGLQPNGVNSKVHDLKSTFACPEPTPCPAAEKCPTLPPSMPPPSPTPALPVDHSMLPRDPPPHTDLADYKIYVYDDPVMAMEGLLDDCGPYSGRPDDDDFPRIHELMLRSPRRTMDPSEASLFFVNIPVFQSWSCPVRDGTEKESAAAHLRRMKAAVGAMKKTTWWQRYKGEDHVMTMHNWRFTGGRKANPIDASLQSAFAGVAATRLDGDRSRPCVCKRDIVAPYPTHPALNYTHTTYSGWEARELTFYYQTRTSTSRAPYSTILRHGPVVLPPSLPGHVARGNEDEAVWATRWQDAKYCLVIRGDSPTSHAFSNALLSSCIPIIISDAWIDIGMPFRDKVDLKKFAIVIEEDSFLQAGNNAIIAEIEGQKVATLKKKLEYLVNYAAPRLVAAHPNSLVGEMLIEEALERMYALPPGDTTV